MNKIMLCGKTAAIAAKPTMTVEAEYGTTLVEGTLVTLAHHTRAGTCPCLAPNTSSGFAGDIIVSHVDLDTVGGALACMGLKPHGEEFWYWAAEVDVRGPHIPIPPTARLRLAAYWVWAQKPENRAPRVRDDEAVDVTTLVIAHSRRVAAVIQAPGSDPVLQEGKEFMDQEAVLNLNSFVQWTGETIVRQSDKFVNHLYTAPSGLVAEALVAINTTTGAITLSFRDDTARKGRNASDIMRKAFGPDAGGHPGIAGTPRGIVYANGGIQQVLDVLNSENSK